ncbi:hypothetical protein Ddye_006161 [Dipteronia dyeriana]|uniref:Uncharacterized protein n=1 Tax=Dipteronia dyeriana TaxID=168575 RepID=A0AAD9XHX4_9ROSI|nr:hypothetical protein Ddye_006161 [Dipteronia dyeriana]
MASKDERNVLVWGDRALDGTFIQVHVPEVDKPRFRSRTGEIATNVLGVCFRDMIFTFILSRWEGSASDSRVLWDALTRPTDLKVSTDPMEDELIELEEDPMDHEFIGQWFGWKDVRNCIEVDSDEAWKSYVQHHKQTEGFRGKHFPLYERLANIFGKDLATGKAVKTPDQQAANFDKGDNFGIDFEIPESFSPMSMNQSQFDINGTQASQPSSRKD